LLFYLDDLKICEIKNAKLRTISFIPTISLIHFGFIRDIEIYRIIKKKVLSSFFTFVFKVASMKLKVTVKL